MNDGGDAADRLLAGLDPDQREAVTVSARSLRVLAGPGSGKTRVLTRRIAWRCASGAAAPDHVVALTFTRRAAGELRQRLAGAGLRDVAAVGTFHSLALTRLRRRAADAGRRPPRLEPPAVILDKIGTSQDVRPALLGELSWAAARRLGPEEYAAAAAEADRRPGLPVQRIAELLDEYATAKRRRRLVDYDDLLGAWIHALRNDRGFRRAEHWRVRHLFVDEFQDLTPLQIELVRMLRGPDADLCVVGDPDQSVYGFAGAEPAGLLDLDAIVDDLVTVELRHDHRSTEAIASAAALVLGRAPRPARPGGAAVRRLGIDHAGDESDRLADLLRDARRDGRDWSDLAVLARTNRRLTELETGLARHGIPTRSRRSPLDSSAAREARATLRTAPTIRAGIESLVERLDGTVDVVTRSGLRAVIELAEELVRLEPEADRNDLAAYWALPHDRTRARGRTVDAVELSTFHAAKGLEWPVVVLAGLEDGVCPPVGATRSELDEERRLVYVAMTRAIDELHVTWCRRRELPGGRDVVAAASPFIAELDDAPPPPVLGGEAWRDEVARQRSMLRDSTEADRRTRRERLVAWRDDAARVARIPSSAVLRDDLVDALSREPAVDLDTIASTTGWGPGQLRRLGPGLLDALLADQSARS